MHSPSERGSGSPERRYRETPAPLHFPESLQVPEIKAHLERRFALYDSLKLGYSARACVGSSQFIYWDASDPRQCAAPDVFVRLGVPDRPFRIWKIWELGAPHVAIEIINNDDRRETTRREKIARYHRMGVDELVCFDLENPEQPLRVWDRVQGDFVERVLESAGVAECGPLESFWVVVGNAGDPWLRLSKDPRGTQLLPTAAEAAEQARRAAESERDELLRRLRELEAKRSERGG